MWRILVLGWMFRYCSIGHGGKVDILMLKGWVMWFTRISS